MDREEVKRTERMRIYTPKRKRKKYPDSEISQKFGKDAAIKALNFHRTFPQYEMTPLVSLDDMSDILGVSGIYIKDESRRFGLNAFKVLGSSFAIGSMIAERLGADISSIDHGTLISQRSLEITGKMTFITATDGNHGRGVAWTAKVLRAGCVVYMPKGSSEERLTNIRELGAKAEITDLSYDDAVRLAASDAERYGWTLIQDTSWEGYEKIPETIMQGYTTMALEIAEQLGDIRPTHIFLQAGVGAMAGAVTAFFRDIYRNEDVRVIIVEPDRADCLYRTAMADDGKLHAVTGDMDTIMAGLACGEPCPAGWRVLSEHADHFISMSDEIAAEGMRILGNPEGKDERIVSGESGAAGFGAFAYMMMGKGMQDLRETLGLDRDSVILCISTEGDTDREDYRNIVWRGKYPSY